MCDILGSKEDILVEFLQQNYSGRKGKTAIPMGRHFNHEKRLGKDKKRHKARAATDEFYGATAALAEMPHR